MRDKIRKPALPTGCTPRHCCQKRFGTHVSSPRPQRGPEPSSRMSLAIFMSATATVFSAPDAATMGSWAAGKEKATMMQLSIGEKSQSRDASSHTTAYLQGRQSGSLRRQTAASCPLSGRRPPRRCKAAGEQGSVRIYGAGAHQRDPPCRQIQGAC